MDESKEARAAAACLNIDSAIEASIAEKDMLDHPEHYTTGNMSGIECWDHYELAFNEDEFRGAMKNNLYKYIFRVRKKGDQVKFIEDLGKCIRYLERWIKFEEGHRIGWYKYKPVPVEDEDDDLDQLLNERRKYLEVTGKVVE